MYDKTPEELEAERLLNEAQPISDPFSNISKYISENEVQSPEVPEQLPVEEVVSQDEATPVRKRDVNDIKKLIAAVRGRKPASTNESSEKEDNEKVRLSDSIENTNEQLSNDPNLTDEDRVMLNRKQNLDEAKLAGMKGVQVSNKSKELKAAEKLDKEDGELASKFLDEEQSKLQASEDPVEEALSLGGLLPEDQPQIQLEDSPAEPSGSMADLQKLQDLNNINPADKMPVQLGEQPSPDIQQVSQDIEEVKAEIQDNAQDPEVDPIIQMRKDRDLKESLANMMKYADQAARAYGGGSVTNIKNDSEFYDDMAKKAGRPIEELLGDRKRAEAKEIADMRNTILGDQVEMSEKDSAVSNLKRQIIQSKYGKELEGMDLEGLSSNQLSKIEDMVKSGDKKGLTSYQQALLDYRNNRLDLSRQSLGLRGKKFEFQESEQDQKKVVNLSKAIGKEGIPEMNKNFSTFNDIVEKRGSSVIDQINRMTPSYLQELKGEEGSDIIKAKMSLYSIINTVLKRRSGAAVTDQEYDRFLKEIGAGHLDSKGSVVEGVNFLKSKMQSVEDNINAGFDSKTLKTFKENKERESKKSPKSESPKFKKELKSGFTRVIKPNGKVIQIPTSEVQEAIEDGLKVME